MDALSKQEKIVALKEWFAKTKMNAEINSQTLGAPYTSVTPQVFLAASEKLIAIGKGESEPDDRDNLRFSTFLGIEDQVREHIEKDAGKLQRKAQTKMQQKKNLSWLHGSYFTPQVKSVVVGNALSANVEGINPFELFDNSHKMTKLGEGGIPSTTAIPAESRTVNPSSFGFIDPLHITENESIGVTGYMATGVVKGKDGKLYKIMKNKKGELVWVDHQTLLNSKVEIPER
jgi:DNA-directed RNA polymerase beta subunit